MTLLPQPYIVGCDEHSALLQNASAFTVLAWSVANRALYRPLVLPSVQRLSAVSVWCTTTGSGTFDLGLYDETCTTRLTSMGSTALSASAINTWTLSTPFLIPAGKLFYLGMSCSTNVSSFCRQSTNILGLRAIGVTQEATAHPLPATATPATPATAYLPTFALTFVK